MAAPVYGREQISPLAQIAGERERERDRKGRALEFSLWLCCGNPFCSRAQAESEISDYACRRRGADGRGATRLEFTQSMVQTFD